MNDKSHHSQTGMKPKLHADTLGAVRPDGANLSVRSLTKRASCLIIYTGGTIGMKPVEDGTLRPAQGYIERMLQTVPEFHHPDVPTYDVLEWAAPLDSSDFSPACWSLLAKQIEQHYYDYDGFVVLHGTDTMAYTASALSFMLENLGKSVIITGAMIPLAYPVSDAKRNLIVSLMCAANLDIPEVCIFFNDVLLRGNRAKKLDPGTVNPFHSPNFPPLATMGVRIALQRDIILPAPRRKFHAHTRMYGNIAVMLLVPGFDDLALQSFVATSTRDRPAVLVLMLYGAGNAPSQKESFLETMRNAIQNNGAIVVITSQCLHGTVDMSQYATGNVLRQMGVIDGRDMTVEATVTKLAFLLGAGLRGQQLKTAMEQNLRGELTLKQTQDYTHNEFMHQQRQQQTHHHWIEGSSSSSSSSPSSSLTSTATSPGGMMTPLPKSHGSDCVAPGAPQESPAPTPTITTLSTNHAAASSSSSSSPTASQTQLLVPSPTLASFYSPTGLASIHSRM